MRATASRARLKLLMRFLLAAAGPFASSVAFADDAAFKYKELADFKRLDEFSDPVAFETYISAYVQDCLDHTGGGTGGIPCNIADELWNRELDTYYARLLSALDPNGRKRLKADQLAWSRSRDESTAFHQYLADLYYPKQGTMFLLMRSQDLHSTMADMAKERTLLLKRWLELNAQQLPD